MPLNGPIRDMYSGAQVRQCLLRGMRASACRHVGTGPSSLPPRRSPGHGGPVLEVQIAATRSLAWPGLRHPGIRVEGQDMTTVEKRAGIRPFQMEVPEEALADLRRRLAATRWPSQELVEDRSQGVQLATIRELARYWASDYDLRRVQARLNALPQFTTEIDGVEIHFVHVRSPHSDALPLIMTHGWPGSVIEMLDSVGPLTDPTAHGGTAADAFHLVLPSLPGYGFSGEPAELGWDLPRTARAWAELMRRLGYDRYVAQGGDVGAGVTDAMGRLGPDGLVGIHTNLLVPALNDPASLPHETDAERAALAAIKTFQTSGNGYFV